MMKHYDIDYDDQALFKSSVNKDSYRWLMDARIRIARTKVIGGRGADGQLYGPCTLVP